MLSVWAYNTMYQCVDEAVRVHAVTVHAPVSSCVCARLKGSWLIIWAALAFHPVHTSFIKLSTIHLWVWVLSLVGHCRWFMRRYDLMFSSVLRERKNEKTLMREQFIPKPGTPTTVGKANSSRKVCYHTKHLKQTQQLVWHNIPVFPVNTCVITKIPWKMQSTAG